MQVSTILERNRKLLTVGVLCTMFVSSSAWSTPSPLELLERIWTHILAPLPRVAIEETPPPNVTPTPVRPSYGGRLSPDED